MKRKAANGSALWRLFRAIAAGDESEVSRLLKSSPHLASDAEPVGASRQSSTPFFLDDIKHHVYAGHTALHVAMDMWNLDDYRIDLKELGKRAAHVAEREAIAIMLRHTGGDKRESAARLGISYKAILYKIRDFGLARPRRTVLSRTGTAGT